MKRLRPFVGLLALALLGCGQGDAQPASGGGPRRQSNQPAPVRVEAVTQGAIRLRLELVGEIEARRAVDLAAAAPGKLVKVLVEMGDEVEEGQLLAELDGAALRAKLVEAQAASSVSQAAIRRAEAELRSVTSELGRKAPLAEDDLITPQEMDQLQSRHDAAEANFQVSKAQVTQAGAAIKVLSQQLRDTRLVAPFAARVQARLLDPGAVVNAGTPVLKLVHTDPAVVRFQVSEQQVGRLRQRAAAEASLAVQLGLPAYPGRSFTGRLVRISPALDPQSRSATAEAEFENPESELMPGMFCRLTIDLGGRDDALLVPRAALVQRGKAGAQGAFVVREGRAKLVPLTLGAEQDRLSEVLDGLALGDQVVVEGQTTLTDGRPVKLVDGASKAPAKAPPAGGGKAP